ncbi:hypothetical protein [Cellulomonas sp. KRMCY2]|uniref:hypothetical protein n=1 Tax=Cellulomonas sp. KRMCY2 TaxID=1304865 RepID=UPI00045E97F2|nr:hypothetical protein [Cellulomonas sp. KRMCY2]
MPDLGQGPGSPPAAALAEPGTVGGPAAPAPDGPVLAGTPVGTGIVSEGFEVVRDAGRLLLAHWPPLVLLALIGVVVREPLLAAAAVASRTSAVLSQLVLALAPFAQVLTIVGMLLVLRRREPDGPADRQRALRSLLTGTAAVLVPFLVIYEYYGTLREDVVALGIGLVEDLDVFGGDDVTARLPAATSAAVLATVAVALLARFVLGRLVTRTPGERHALRSALRLAAGYCEVVW